MDQKPPRLTREEAVKRCISKCRNAAENYQEGDLIGDDLREIADALSTPPPTPGLVEAAREFFSTKDELEEAIHSKYGSYAVERAVIDRIDGLHRLAARNLRSALASYQAEVPHPRLIEAAKRAEERLGDCASRELAWGAPEEAHVTSLISDALRSALAECGEWERVTGETKTQGGTAEALEALHNLTPEEFLRVLGKLWPGAEVWRKRGKKEEEG